jgi:hypothetical protein
VVQALDRYLAKQLDDGAFTLTGIGEARLARDHLAEENVVHIARVDQMLVQVPILGGRGQGYPLLADENPATDVFSPDVDRTTLVGPHQEPEHFL